MNCFGTVFRSLSHVPLAATSPSKQQSHLTQTRACTFHVCTHHRHTPVLRVHVLLFFTENSVHVQFRRDPVIHTCAPGSSLPCHVEAQPHQEPCLVRLASPAQNVMEGTDSGRAQETAFLGLLAGAEAPALSQVGSSCLQKALGGVDRGSQRAAAFLAHPRALGLCSFRAPWEAGRSP